MIDPDDDIDNDVHRESTLRMSRDLVRAAAHMTHTEARFLVDRYYAIQEMRKRADNQASAMSAEPHSVIVWLAGQSTVLEGQVKRALTSYTDHQDVGKWMKSIVGIGPVISAGLIAHLDIVRAPTVGHFYSFAGIAGADQTPWEKHTKRPFNADLKELCWKIGQSFMKFSGRDDCYYGHKYRRSKARYAEKNAAGDYAAQAAERLETQHISKSTDLYSHLACGRLPPAQIDARARRFAVKYFLSHAHLVMYWHHHHELPRMPYPHEHQRHTKFEPPPNVALVNGLEAALRAQGLLSH
jgi:hypothetical protein